MARNLTPAEKASYKQIFPRLNVNNVLVMDEPTPVYNCLAWTLGITNAWVWPWSSANVTKSDFDALYKQYGYSPGGSGTIAAFGLNLGMTHGSIFSYPMNTWESKLGKLHRITHPIAELEGGTTYGDVKYYYARAIKGVDMSKESFRAAGSNEDMKPLTEFEERLLSREIEKIDALTITEFEARYAEWRRSCEHFLIAVSSNPHDRTKTIEYRKLLSLGKPIVPLLVKKLADPDEFFALQVLDGLFSDEIIIRKDPEDLATLDGEQGRARETIKRWVESNL